MADMAIPRRSGSEPGVVEITFFGDPRTLSAASVAMLVTIIPSYLTFAHSKEKIRRRLFCPPATYRSVTRGPDPEISAVEILRFMVEHPDPAFTAKEVSGQFEKTRQWADNRLKAMEGDSLLESKNPGGRSRFYWPSPEGKQKVWDEREGGSS